MTAMKIPSVTILSNKITPTVSITINMLIVLHSSVSMTAENKECYKLF